MTKKKDLKKYGRYLLGNNFAYHRIRTDLILKSVDIKDKSIVDFGAGFCDIIVDLLNCGAKEGLAIECSPQRFNNKERMRTHTKLKLITKEFPCEINRYFDIGMILGNTSEFFKTENNFHVHKKMFECSDIFIVEARSNLIPRLKKEAEDFYKSFKFVDKTKLKRELWIFSEKKNK